MKRVLIANRGEIACRIIRACKRLRMATIAVYSEADAEALHVTEATEAVLIGPSKPAQSYLDMNRILQAARVTAADAIHPGYGFLSENAEFARRVEAEGLIWIGPAPDTIASMGDKDRARQLAASAGVPILSGSSRFIPDDTSALAEAAERVGYPLLVKAAAGGGGIGMQRVDVPEALAKTVETTMTMAERAFGDASVFLERFIPRARHIEIQVFGFGDGRAVHVFERECSLQRRFQKIVEESPAPGLAPGIRDRMAAAAVALAEQERYRGAGTVEFVYEEESEEFFFLEMNTRIQVEHPVSEAISGMDLVGLQLQLARGDDLSALTQSTIHASGHAIECRIYAENPAMMFLPSPGKLEELALPCPDRGLRVDTGVRSGDQITPFYDPMIAKLITHGETRDEALTKMREALAGSRIKGIKTNLAFLARLLDDPDVVAGRLDTRLVDRKRETLATD